MNKQELIEMYQEAIDQLKTALESTSILGGKAVIRTKISGLEMVVSDLKTLQFDNKPSWDDAPSWANWMAMDEDGEWLWYEREPVMKVGYWDSYGQIKSASNPPKIHFSETLEQRPE